MLRAVEVRLNRTSATLIHASLFSINPPSTDCSASIECGGTFSCAVADRWAAPERGYRHL